MLENHTSFMNRFHNLTKSEQMRIELAYILSKDAHRHQTRKTGERYFEHPRRVALILIDILNIYEPDLIISSLLHDIVEDTKYINLEFINHFFGSNSKDIVEVLTKQPNDNYWLKLSLSGVKPIIVKCCDRYDNLLTIENTSNAFIEKQIKETEDKLFPIIQEQLKILLHYNQYWLDKLNIIYSKLQQQIQYLRGQNNAQLVQ